MKKHTRFLMSIAGLLWMAALVVFPAAASDGIRNGLTLCGELLIPSLFPAMVASALLVQSGAIDRLGHRLNPITQRLWHLPGCSGGVFLLAMVGGYPLGARCIRSLMDEHRLTPAQGAHLLHLCVGAGPGFGVSVVGCGLFGSVRMGLLLWGSQILSAVVLSLLRRCPAPLRITGNSTGSTDGPSGCIRDAAAGMLSLCAWVLTFCSLLALLKLLPLPAGIVTALELLAEVTAGVRTARTLGSPAAAAFVLGWGGWCVHAQIAAVGIPWRGFMWYRFLHGLFAALCTAALLPLVPFDGTLPAGRPLHGAVTAVHTPFSLALLGLVAVFLLQLPVSQKNKKISPER